MMNKFWQYTKKYEREPMLDALLALLHREYGISHLSEILSDISHLVAKVDENYLADKSMKNAAIDSLIQILQTHKNV